MSVTRVFVTAVCLAAACACDSKTTSPSAGPTLAVPVPQAPGDLAQLTSLRPTLSVKNGSSDSSATKTYEFQVADTSTFAASTTASSFAVMAHQTGVAESASGTTTFTPDFDLQPATKFYWRARLVQGTSASAWTPTRSFNTAIVGYNRAGELYDPLIYGHTIGTIVGSTTFIEGQGIKLNDKFAYVRYQLEQPLQSGEFSLEIAGLSPNGPGAKLKLFEMSDSTANVFNSPWLFTAQYRGVAGNPDNSIAYKMRLGDPFYQLETDGNDRTKSIRALDPSHFYFFKMTWDNGLRMIIQDSVGVGTTYDVEYKSTDYFAGRLIRYAPNPHFAYLGGNDTREGPEDGTWPGEIVRNVFIGNKTRPASLGSALPSAR